MISNVTLLEIVVCRYVINAGAFTALCASLLGGILPQVNKFNYTYI